MYLVQITYMFQPVWSSIGWCTKRN